MNSKLSYESTDLSHEYVLESSTMCTLLEDSTAVKAHTNFAIVTSRAGRYYR